MFFVNKHDKILREALKSAGCGVFYAYNGVITIFSGNKMQIFCENGVFSLFASLRKGSEYFQCGICIYSYFIHFIWHPA